MKKILLLALMVLSSSINSQNLITESFDNVSGLFGWTMINMSTPVGTQSNWFQVNTAVIPQQEGTGHIGCNFNSVAGANTISNWLTSPAMMLQDGDIITFYTRTFDAPAFADRLQLRLTTTPVDPSAGNEDLGGYTNLLLDINPALNLTDYPNVWTLQTVPISGIGATEVPCKIAFRYYVTDGGPNGANSDGIFVDNFKIDRPLSTQSFLSSKYSIYPNPASNVINIADVDGLEILNSSIIDINGRIVKNLKGNLNQINISDLNAGVYFLNLETSKGTATKKIVKN